MPAWTAGLWPACGRDASGPLCDTGGEFRASTTMTTLLYTHPACLDHDPGQHHPESPARLRAVLEALAAPEFAGLDHHEAPEAALADIARVHPRRFIEAMLAAGPSSGRVRIHAATLLSPESHRPPPRARRPRAA